MSWSEVTEKFRDCAGLVLSRKNIDETIRLIEGFENLKSLRPLVRALTSVQEKRTTKHK
jgi:hypothetical protein